MARSAINVGFPYPNYIAESRDTSGILPGVYICETSGIHSPANTITLADITLSATGKLTIAGTLSATLGDVTLSGTGAFTIVGSLSATLDDVTLSATSTVLITGSLSATLGDVTLSADSTSGGATGITGSLSTTLDDVTLSGTGNLGIAGALSVTLDDVTLSGAGTSSHAWDGSTAAIKIAGAAIVETSATDAIKIAGAEIIENAPTSAFKIAGAVIFELNYVPVYPNPPPIERRDRVRLGMAEYSHTSGLDAYELRGAIPSFETFRSQLRDGEHFRYRAVSGVKQEVGEAIFDWPGNRIIRTGPSTPASAVNSTPQVDWGEGRKIIHFVEDDGIRLTSPRLIIGLAEYTDTEGLVPYVLRGALREYQTLASRLGHAQPVKYRATNNAKEEISTGVYDAVNNTLVRNLAIIPSEPVNWGPGRKLIYITEIY